ncbi:MAG: hypothetical protein LBT53_00800 [Puniceicoccales bacterium]|nr:hypothetical protein [Puniceicoccales bacterium]
MRPTSGVPRVLRPASGVQCLVSGVLSRPPAESRPAPPAKDAGLRTQDTAPGKTPRHQQHPATRLRPPPRHTSGVL